ncbi:MAG: TlpA disulfide reductase family protein [Candidatus Omnitrophota bacterium]|nr:TlpA disulfide reductase family protein [Candidatus Omnitrophota bacterium]
MRRVIAFLAVFLFCFFSPLVSAEDHLGEQIEGEEPCPCPVSLGKAPNFTLKDLKGNEVKLSDFNGKGIILYFWATTCPICVEHTDALNKMYTILKEKNIEFIAIGMGETKNRVNRFMKRKPIDFPVLLDTNGKVSQSYVILGPPSFVIINKTGYIRFQNFFWPLDYEKYICE